MVSDKFLNRLATHTDKLGMHLVSFYLLTLHWFKSACSNMKSQLLTINTMCIKGCKHFWRKMQSSGRCCYTAFDFGIDGLIGSFVALFCLTIQIGRNRQLAHHINQLGKGDIPIPLKINTMTRTMQFSACCTNRYPSAPNLNLTFQ